MDARKLEKQILKKLGPASASAPLTARYVGAVGHEKRKDDERSQLRFLGLSTPNQRELAKQMSSFFSKDHSPEQVWKSLVKLWSHTKVFEVRNLVLNWMGDKKQKSLVSKNIKDLFQMAGDIDNWAHSDSLSSLLAAQLESNPQLLSTYLKWNKSKNPWLRRQSIVGIYCYAQMRKQHIPAEVSIPLVEALLDDPHFYVQRGVGWTLREIDRVNSPLQRKFVEKNLHRISSTAWFATSELYPVALRKKHVLRRKALRKSP